MSNVKENESRNPFLAKRVYSPDAVELMRALSAYRQKAGQGKLSPAQVLSVVCDLGYRRIDGDTMSAADASRLFILAMTQFQKQNDVTHPSCQDVLDVLSQLHYCRPIEDTPTVISGLPIDRRRREADERAERNERRSSLATSAQEQMELSEVENAFLDALKKLRKQTGREFASSEELLSIVWSLGYRSVNDDGYVQEWLDEDDRCTAQIEFTSKVEQQITNNNDNEFLTSRNLLDIAEQIGFRQPS